MKLFAIIASLFLSAPAFAVDWSISSSLGSLESEWTSTFRQMSINDESANYTWEFRIRIGDKSAGASVGSRDFLEDEFAMMKFIVVNAIKGGVPEVSDFECDVIVPLLKEGSAPSLQLAQQKWSSEIHRLALIDYSAPK